MEKETIRPEQQAEKLVDNLLSVEARLYDPGMSNYRQGFEARVKELRPAMIEQFAAALGAKDAEMVKWQDRLRAAQELADMWKERDRVSCDSIAQLRAEIDRLKTERDQAITEAAKIAQRRTPNCIKCGDPASEHFGGKCKKCGCQFGEYGDDNQIPFELTEHLIAEIAQLRSQLAVATDIMKMSKLSLEIFLTRGDFAEDDRPKIKRWLASIDSWIAQAERKGIK